MRKIAVIGCGGAGKSTFSRSLSEILNIPVYHLDKLNWKTGWVPTPKNEWNNIMNNLVSKEEWIIDGNYGGTLDIRLRNADTIIYLNMPMYLCIYRIIKRRFMYHRKSRPDMDEGCPEKLDMKFINWVWGYNKKQKPSILDTLKNLSMEKNIFILNSPAEADKFMHDLKSSINLSMM